MFSPFSEGWPSDDMENSISFFTLPLGFLIEAEQRTAPQFRHPIFQLV